MSIRFRFTLSLAAVGVVLFGSYAVLAYQSESDELRVAAMREIRITGRSLEIALGNALRDRQHADVDEMLTRLDVLEPSVDLHVFGQGGRVLARSRGEVTSAAIQHVVERVESSRAEHVTFMPQDDPSHLVFAAPLTADDGAILGTIAVARPIADLDADLERTRDRLLLAVGLFVLGTLIAGLTLGTLHVTRPIDRLLAATRQVRDGDFRTTVRSARNDELGLLSAEFNDMLEALTEARARQEADAEARARLERGLQRIDKLVTIGQLSANLAHEIGSPLQVVAGRAAALAAHADPEVRRQAELLVAQCDRITHVVEQLLSVGRRRPASIRPCNLVEPVRLVTDLLAVEAGRRGSSLVVETDAEEHRIDADPDQLQQLILNLVKNALAATPAGGTTTVRVDRAGEHVRLSVRDTGPGISNVAQAQLFEPFFTTRSAEGGTGLGLAVVQAIATEHRARIEVSSIAGRGSEFVVWFPSPASSHG